MNCHKLQGEQKNNNKKNKNQPWISGKHCCSYPFLSTQYTVSINKFIFSVLVKFPHYISNIIIQLLNKNSWIALSLKIFVILKWNWKEYIFTILNKFNTFYLKKGDEEKSDDKTEDKDLINSDEEENDSEGKLFSKYHKTIRFWKKEGT